MRGGQIGNRLAFESAIHGRVVVLGTRTRVPFFGDLDSDSDLPVGDLDLEVQYLDSPLWYSTTSGVLVYS